MLRYLCCECTICEHHKYISVNKLKQSTTPCVILLRLTIVPVEIENKYILVSWIVYSTGNMPGTRSQKKSKNTTTGPYANTGISISFTASVTTGKSILV